MKPDSKAEDIQSFEPGKPRVLVIGPYPPPFAGPEMAIKMLLDSPLKDAFTLTHLSTNVRKSNADKGRPGVQLITAFTRFFSRLAMALARTRPGIVYYFVTATRMGWLGRDVWCIALSRLFGAKVVIHMRAGHFRHRLRQANKLEMALIRWACRRVHLALVQAPSLRDQFEGLARPERIAVVPNMIDVERYAAVPPQSCKQGRILFLGHLSVAKGYCELLKAIPRIATEFPEVCFEIAGTRLDKERNVHHVQTTGKPLPNEDPDVCHSEFVAGRFEPNYNYVGMLDEEAKIAALGRCDFLVLPSFSEGFSMAVLEAMTMGKPVVCTAVGAMRDFVVSGRHGEVIEPGDTDGLITAIRKLLVDRAYRDRVAAENARYTREHFSQAVIGAQLEKLFQAALSGGLLSELRIFGPESHKSSL